MKHKRKRILAEINITPLTDVFLVLLIIMMVAAPILNTVGISAALAPDGESEADPNADKVLAVRITSAGGCLVDGEAVEAADVGDALRASASAYPGGISLEVDPAAPLKFMTGVLDEARSAGITNVSISKETVDTPSPEQKPAAK